MRMRAWQTAALSNPRGAHGGAQEVEVLMSILIKYCAQFEEEAKKNNIRVKVLSTDRDRVRKPLLPW